MKTVLQLSGGRDSLATLFFVEPAWDELTVAWCDSGDSAPELLALMSQIEKLVPHFERVPGYAREVRELYGDPVAGAWTDCCARSIWYPMLEWVLANDFERIVRGTRRVDPIAYPRPGEKLYGLTFDLPIWDWSDKELHDALAVIAARGFKPVYPHDCLHCPVTRVCDRPELRNVA